MRFFGGGVIKVKGQDKPEIIKRVFHCEKCDALINDKKCNKCGHIHLGDSNIGYRIYLNSKVTEEFNLEANLVAKITYFSGEKQYVYFGNTYLDGIQFVEDEESGQYIEVNALNISNKIKSIKIGIVAKNNTKYYENICGFGLFKKLEIKVVDIEGNEIAISNLSEEHAMENSLSVVKFETNQDKYNPIQGVIVGTEHFKCNIA